MWAKFGRRTEESKKVTGYFSGSPDSQWGTSSASYAQSIEMLKSTAWEEIEDGALEFAKFGRQFKTASSGIKDVRAYIMDCDSDDDSVSSSVSGHNENDSQECAASQVERNWEQWNCDEDVPSPRSALAASQILDFHTAGPQPTPRLQPLVSADAAALQSRSQTTIGVTDTCQQLPPLALVCSQENTLPFVPGTTISLPPLTADQFSVHHSPAPAPTSENSSIALGLDHRQVHQHSVPEQGSTGNYANMWQDPYMMPSGLRFGNRFLTGPSRTIDADNDLDY